MSFEATHQEAAELLGVFAVDAADPDEAALVEAHLAECPRCRAELDALREVAGALGTANDQPPPELWERIQRQLDVPSSFAVAPAMPELARSAAPLVVPAATTTPGPVRSRSHRRSRTTTAVLCAVAAGALVAIVLLATSLQSVNSRVSQLQADLSNASIARQAIEALGTPGSQVVSLSAPDGTRMAEAVVAPTGRGYLLPTKEMPTLASSKTYQLWVVSGSTAISVGVLGPHPTPASFAASGAHGPYTLALTVEKAPGAAQPTSQPVAQGNARTTA